MKARTALGVGALAFFGTRHLLGRGVVNRLLPAPGGIGRGTAKGHESESALCPSWLTRLGDAAAVRHNEVPNARRPA